MTETGPMRGPVRQADKERHLYWIGGFVVLVAIAVAAAAFFFPRDPDLSADLCPASGPIAHVTLLIDATDPFTFTQQRAVRQLAAHIADPSKSVEGTLLSVYVFGANIEKSAEPLFEKCNPGTGSNKSEITHTRKLWEDRFTHEFQQPLEHALDALQPKIAASKSPILQMLQIVGLNYQKRNSKGERRLLMISDLLQNTSELSLYREVPEHEVFRRRPEAARLTADLRGVVVQAYVLMNTPQIQNRRLLKFWEDYFSSAGARMSQVELLPG